MGALTLVIGGICSAMGSWDSANDSYLLYKKIALGIASLLYVILIAYYSTHETNERKIAFIYAQQNAAFEEVMVGLMNVCKRSADGANKVIKSIINKKQVDLELWSFDE